MAAPRIRWERETDRWGTNDRAFLGAVEVGRVRVERAGRVSVRFALRGICGTEKDVKVSRLAARNILAGWVRDWLRDAGLGQAAPADVEVAE